MSLVRVARRTRALQVAGPTPDAAVRMRTDFARLLDAPRRPRLVAWLLAWTPLSPSPRPFMARLAAGAILTASAATSATAILGDGPIDAAAGVARFAGNVVANLVPRNDNSGTVAEPPTPTSQPSAGGQTPVATSTPTPDTSASATATPSAAAGLAPVATTTPMPTPTANATSSSGGPLPTSIPTSVPPSATATPSPTPSPSPSQTQPPTPGSTQVPPQPTTAPTQSPGASPSASPEASSTPSPSSTASPSPGSSPSSTSTPGGGDDHGGQSTKTPESSGRQ